MDWHFFFFLFFALLTCGFAAATLFARNVVRMAFFLVLSLGATSGLFFLAGSEFVAAMQLMIYVGGTLVLLVFGVMLTASDAAVSMRSSPMDWVLAAVPSLAIFVLLATSVLAVPQWNAVQASPTAEAVAAENDQTVRIGMALIGVRLDQRSEGAVGRLSGYLLPFEIVSVHLLVALIGAGYLARPKRRLVDRLPDAIVVADSPAWYRVAMNVALGLATAKLLAYLLIPGLVTSASEVFLPARLKDELSQLPAYWTLPMAATVGVFAVGTAMLRFRNFAGSFVQAVGLLVAAGQFASWGATTTAAFTAAGALLSTVVFSTLYFASSTVSQPALGRTR